MQVILSDLYFTFYRWRFVIYLDFYLVPLTDLDITLSYMLNLQLYYNYFYIYLILDSYVRCYDTYVVLIV